MIRSRLSVIMTASLLVLFCFATPWAQKQTDTKDTDSAAIKQTISAWSSAWNRHDGHGCAMQFAEDGDFVSAASGNITHGRKDVEAHYVKIFVTDNKDAHRTDTVKSIRFLSPDIATANITWEMTGSSGIPLRKGFAEPILVKQDGQWLIAVFDEADFKVTSTK